MYSWNVFFLSTLEILLPTSRSKWQTTKTLLTPHGHTRQSSQLLT
jgi:hypothetical protein